MAAIAAAWKFGLEEWADPFLPGEHVTDSEAERWEFVVMSTLFAMVATSVPAFLAHRLIGERMKADRLSAAVFNSAPQPMLVADHLRMILAVNPAFEALSGWNGAQLVGQPVSILRSGELGDELYQEISRCLDTRGEWHGEVWNRRLDGSPYAVALTISGVRDEAGQIIQFIGVLTDITWRKQREEQALHDATHDPLTGLANRRLFHDRLQQVIAASTLSGERFALLFIDLDGFKQVNDTLGHAVGDALLVEVAKRLAASGRAADLTARLAGDEFVMILRDIRANNDAEAAAARAIERVAAPLILADGQLEVRASIGIAIYPDDGKNAEALMQHADRAMYTAKRNQKRPSVPATAPRISDDA